MITHSQVALARYRKDLPLHRANRADIPVALSALLPDMFALYLKTKNLHWRVSGVQFPGYPLLLDDQAAQILTTTDLINERVRKLAGRTITCIGYISQLQDIQNNDADDEVAPCDMLAALLKDNRLLAKHMKEVRTLCDERGDVVTASLVENWIDEAEGRAWFLHDAARPGSFTDAINFHENLYKFT
jgi:starvation-inducible DNA-binding protein